MEVLAAILVASLARMRVLFTRYNPVTGKDAPGRRVRIVISDFLGGSKVLLIGNVIEHQFTQVGDWNVGSGLSLVLMIFILISMAVMQHYDKGDAEGVVL